MALLPLPQASHPTVLEKPARAGDPNMCPDPGGRVWTVDTGRGSQTHVGLHGEVQLEEDEAATSPVGSGGCSLGWRLKSCGLGAQFGSVLADSSTALGLCGIWAQGSALD